MTKSYVTCRSSPEQMKSLKGSFQQKKLVPNTLQDFGGRMTGGVRIVVVRVFLFVEGITGATINLVAERALSKLTPD